MSLYENMMTPCVLMQKQSESDGAGGFITTWEQGAQFMCAITMDTTMEAQIAQKQGVTSIYTITTMKNAVLGYQDVVKRLSDGRYFRVTSNGRDKVSPASSNINITQVSAESWELE